MTIGTNESEWSLAIKIVCVRERGVCVNVRNVDGYRNSAEINMLNVHNDINNHLQYNRS